MAISVSQAFKDAMQAPVKVIQATIVTDEQTFTSADYLTNLSIEASGYYFGATTKALEFSLLGTAYDLLNKAINVSISVQTDASNDTWEHCNLGNFYIYEQEVKLEKETTTFKAYDKVGMMAKEYYTGGGFTFPCTVSNLVEQFESKFGLHFTPETLVNGNYQITEDLYAKINNITYRDILAELAGATASIINIGGVGNTITFRETPRTAIETWTYDNLKSIKFETKYGDINSVVLSREPEGDNIVVLDRQVVHGEGAEIEFEGAEEFKSIELDGNSFQQTYTGKNLTKYPYYSGTSATRCGITFTINSDGSVTLNGKNDGSGNSAFYFFKDIEFPAGTYYFIPTGNNAIHYTCYDGSSWRQISNNTNFSVTFASTTNLKEMYVEVSRNNTTTFNNVTVYPMFTTMQNPTVADYEPYVGSSPTNITPAPNPDYPQGVSAVTGRQVISLNGKNLYSQICNSSTAGLTAVGDSAEYTISGTCTTGDNRLWLGTGTLPAGTYTIKHEYLSGGYTGGNLSFWLYFGNTWDRPFTDNLAVDQNTDTKTVTFTIAEEKTVRMAMYTRNGSVFSNFKGRISIESGTVATDFEPYSHQDFEINLGKNLLNNYDSSKTSSGVTITINADGSMVANGTATGIAYALPETQQQSPNFPAGTYTLWVDQIPSAHGQLIVETYKAPDYNTKINNFRGAYGSNKLTFTTTDILRFRVSVVFAQSGDTLDNFRISQLQLEKGTESSDYSPYFEPIRADEIGEYKNRIYRQNGKWYIHKEIEKATLNGSETWESWYNTNYSCIGFYSYAIKNVITKNGIENDYNNSIICQEFSEGRLKSDIDSGLYEAIKHCGIRSDNQYIGISISKDRLSDYSTKALAISSFKTWLASHPVTFYYQLRTPIDTQITNPDLIAQLEDLMDAELYVSKTTIKSSSEDLPTPMDVDAYLKLPYIVELKLANNEILDDDRETLITPILNSVSGFGFYPFEAATEGHGWHECGDRIAVTDGTNTWDVVISYIKLTIDGGIKETIKGIRPTETQTNYALAGGIMKTIYNTEIKVDKQGQEITSIVSRQDSFEDQTLENFSQVVQNINSVTTTIQTTGGGNLLHNSVGYNINTDKTLVSWTQSGSISSESSPESLSYGAISGSQINLGASSSITQRITVDNSGNQLYTLGFKVKKGATGVVTVHLRNNIDDYTVVIPEGSAILWKNYSIVGVLPHSSYFDVVVETNNAVSSLSITDMMFSVGDTTIPWVSASDEILSKNVAVDSSGVTVRSNATNDYTQLNELGLNGYSDASGSMENVFTVNRDTTEVSKLKARKQISMPPIKIVPVTSGNRAGWGFVKGE